LYRTLKNIGPIFWLAVKVLLKRKLFAPVCNFARVLTGTTQHVTTFYELLPNITQNVMK